MRVTYLELQNIKSYHQNTRVELTEGINAVCGSNGSGKTTMLEAIGHALFDFLPYTARYFVREGEKSGVIRVGLLGRDGREYEVVRKVGAGSSHFVVDVETGDRFAERGEAVLNWVREQALDIEPGTDLEALFKNAVGVPQGLMTTDFLQTPATRKAIFDPLLRVEEYRRAAAELLETVNFLRERTHLVSQDIAALRTDTDRLPDKQDEVARLDEQFIAGQEHITRLESHLAEREAARALLDAIEMELAKIDGQLKDARYDVQRRTDLVAAHAEQLESARTSARIVAETEPSYQAVRDSRQQLEALEKRRIECVMLEKELTKVQAEHDGIVQLIARLGTELRQAEEAGVAAAQLLGPVERQKEIEDQRREVEFLLRDLPATRERIERVQREVDRFEKTLTEREPRILQARLAEKRAERLGEVRKQLTSVSEQLAPLAQIRTRQQELGKEGARLREQRVKLVETVARRDDIARRLSEREPLAAMVDQIVTREQEIREQRAGTRAAIEYQELARVALRRSHCPLLELQCPLVSRDQRVLEGFEARATSLAAELKGLDVTLCSIRPELSAAQAAASEAQTLRLELARIENVAETLAEIEAQLRDCISRFNDLSEELEKDETWRREQVELQKELDRLQLDAQLAATIVELESQQETDHRTVGEKRKELSDSMAHLVELDGAKEKETILKQELESLDDPRAEQRRLLSLSGRIPDIGSAINEAQERMTLLDRRLNELLVELQPFKSLAAEFEKYRRLEAEHGSRYERYLQHQAEAAQLSVREQTCTASEAALATAHAALIHVEKSLDSLRDAYDRDAHVALKQECEESRQLLIQQRERQERLQQDLVRSRDELALLRRAEAKLRSLEGERDDLARTEQAVKFIRETLRSAGPAVTETLLRHISEGANDIFAEIVDDHAAELRWDREYEVLVQRGPDTRKFAQLSGGEQMSAALAVRLALLKEMSEVDFAFFDEPTQNMDGERRSNLADQIRQLRGFDQLIVISHDDTFEHHTDNLIRLQKVDGATQVEIG